MDAGQTLDERCRLLRTAWDWWAATLQDVDEQGWRRPTRLPDWDVAALVCHHAMLVRALDHLSRHPIEAEPATRAAAAMLRRFNAPGGAAHALASAVADYARRRAETATPAELTAVFALSAPAAVSAAREAGPVVVEYFGNGSFPLVEAMSIMILEAVVHGLDLAHASGRPPDLPVGPMQFTARLLADIADPVAFIEAATGRSDDMAFPIIR